MRTMKRTFMSVVLMAVFVVVATASPSYVGFSSGHSNNQNEIAEEQYSHSTKHLSTPILHEGRPEEVGFSAKKLLALDTIIRDAIKNHATPGAVLLVAKDGVIVYQKAFGRFTYSPHSERVTVNTIYDLASVTKMAATTISIWRK